VYPFTTARPPSADGRRPRRTRLLASALAFVLALALAGCGADDPATPGNGLETTRLTLSAGPVADMAPIHIALKRGWFKQEGLDVELKPYASGQLGLNALLGGDVDMMFGNYGVMFVARQQKHDVRIVGEASTGVTNTITVIALPKSGIRTPKDLKGKTIGIVSKTGTPTALVNSTLRTAGVDPKTVKYSITALPDIGPALASGAIDAGYVLEPVATKLGKELGAETVLDPLSGQNSGIAINGYAVMGKFATENPKTVVAFQRALRRAQDQATRNRKEVQDALPGFAKIDKPTAEVMALPDFPVTINPVRIQRVVDLMLAEDQLKAPQKVADFAIIPAGQ
jgi:NitT/TauT family transport system substrate-binding protein